MHAHLPAQTTYLFLIEPDFPCLADEIAETPPDKNIKVAAFTVSEVYKYMQNEEKITKTIPFVLVLPFS